MEDQTAMVTWWDSITFAIRDAWDKILGFLPNLIGAFVVIIIGILIALILRWIVVQIFNAIRLDKLSETAKLNDVLAKTGVKNTITELLGNLVKWVVIIVFLLPALQILGMPQVSDILQAVLSYLPKVVVAGFLVFVGIILSDITVHLIKGTAVAIGTSTANILASVAKYAIYVFVGIMALGELGIASTFLLNLFTGVVAMVAIAGGLAFGLGGKDAAADLIKKMREDFSRK